MTDAEGINLLVIDWDFFFPTVEHPSQGEDWQLYDWVHSEARSPQLLAEIWRNRASDFFRAGRDLPGLSGQQRNFWDRFTFTDDAVAYLADSNRYAGAGDVRDDVTSVWLFDAHHDAGYRPGTAERVITEQAVSCEDWMVAYHADDAALHVRYPTWRTHAFTIEPPPQVPVDRAFDDGGPVDVEFGRVFICRSDHWVPPWLDADFEKFVATAPVAELVEGMWDEDGADIELRDFDPAPAKAQAELFAKLLADVQTMTRSSA